MSKIIINDVTLRDGLQNEPYFVDTDKKVALANLIIDSGINYLEITSFVSPKAIPQLSDAFVLSTDDNLKDAYFSALVPNLKGFKKCLNTKIKEAVLFISACEKHNYKNLGRSINETILKLEEIFTEGIDKNINFRAAISMVFGSPFIKSLPDKKDLYKIIEFFLENNVSDITLSDTWGSVDKETFERQLKSISDDFNFENFSLHLHDIGGNACLNVEIALDYGIRKFDTSFKGLGGCPFSPEKGGNLNIRDFFKVLDRKGYEINLDEYKLNEVEKFFDRIRS